MKQINLDEFGLEDFSPARVESVMTWHAGKSKKINSKRYRTRFTLRNGYSEKSPFIWLARLANWRRMESIYFRCCTDSVKANADYWNYITNLWTRTKEECGPNVKSYFLQTLNHKGKLTSSQYLDVIGVNSSGASGISKSSKERKSIKPHDATSVWIWLGTPEEVEANRLNRRAEQLQTRLYLARSAFLESVRIRLASYWRESVKGTNNEFVYYSDKKVFTSVECNGRTYGWISSRGGIGEMVCSPHDPPAFFK